LAQARVAPTSFNINVYQVWVSLNADCSSPVKVIDDGATGRSIDVVAGIDFCLVRARVTVNG
jgi:hypothetical protein